MDSEGMAIDREIVPKLTLSEVAHMLQVHTKTALGWNDQGVIRAYRLNRRGDREFRRKDITRSLSRLEAQRGSPRELQ